MGAAKNGLSETLAKAHVLAEAERLFDQYDRIMLEKNRLDAEIRQLCLRFGEVFGQWGTRPEHVRNVLKLRVAA